MKDYEDEAFDELEKAQQRKVATGVTDGSIRGCMTQDEIIEIAQECRLIGMRPYLDGIYIESLAAFAKLVADKERQEALAQPYDQTALELCNVCGWKTLIPDDACLNCERAQPEQEPVAWMNDTGTHIDLNVSGRGTPLYTTPPQRTWVGLTDDEYDEIWRMDLNNKDIMDKTIAKLKEKNT